MKHWYSDSEDWEYVGIEASCKEENGVEVK